MLWLSFRMPMDEREAFSADLREAVRVAAIQRLSDIGYEVDVTDSDCLSADELDEQAALHLACRYGWVEALQVGGKLGRELLDAPDSDGVTPVYNASLHGHLEVVRLLCKLGVDVNAARASQRTPVYIASQNGDVEIVRLLCEFGANVDAATKNQVTPVYAASHQGHLDVVELLCELGANLNAALPNGMTPAHLASRNRNLALMRLLAKYGADLDVTNDEGETPVHIAYQNGHWEMVELLDTGR